MPELKLFKWTMYDLLFMDPTLHYKMLKPKKILTGGGAPRKNYFEKVTLFFPLRSGKTSSSSSEESLS